MRLDQLPRSDNVEDRRSEDGGAGFRVPGGRSGLGIGTIIVLGLVGYWLGIDPSVLIGGAEILTGGGSSQQQSHPGPGETSSARHTGAPSDQMGEFVSAVLGSTEAQWQKIFAQYGKAYEPPSLVMFSGVTRSACGFAQSAMGHSTVRTIARFISTPRSSRISSDGSAPATPAASPANSRKLT
jgi:uncharacterized protein